MPSPMTLWLVACRLSLLSLLTFLFSSSHRLLWLPQDPAGHGFALHYPSISLHAVSRDLSSFPAPCLYLMLDSAVQLDIAPQTSDSSGQYPSFPFAPSAP